MTALWSRNQLQTERCSMGSQPTKRVVRMSGVDTSRSSLFLNSSSGVCWPKWNNFIRQIDRWNPKYGSVYVVVRDHSVYRPNGRATLGQSPVWNIRPTSYSLWCHCCSRCSTAGIFVQLEMPCTQQESVPAQRTIGRGRVCNARFTVVRYWFSVFMSTGKFCAVTEKVVVTVVLTKFMLQV